MDNFEALDLSMEIDKFRQDMVEETRLFREWANRLTESQRLLIESQQAMINALQAEFETLNRKLDNIDTHLWGK